MTCKHCELWCNKKTYHSWGCCNEPECLEAEKKHKRRKAQKKYYIQHLRKTKEDKKADAEKSRRYRRNNKTKVNRKKALKKAAYRHWLDDYKKTCKCAKCGDDRWFCFDFHHLDSSEKKMKIVEFVGAGYSLQAIQAEIAKCIVLCSNCHREMHHLYGKEVKPYQTEEWLKQNCKENGILI